MDNNKLSYELLNLKNANLLSQPNTQQLSNLYIYCICVFSFDVEVGQILEATYPSNSLNESTLKNLTGLSFPETNSLCEEGEIVYSFKFRKSTLYY